MMTKIKNTDTPASPTNLDITEYAGTINCPHNQPMTGLTRREAFTKDLPHIEIDFGGIDEMCTFIGMTKIPISTMDILALTLEVEAKVRVMRADALLNELSKESK